MDKLQELYAKRKVFEDYGYPIPAELAAEIECEENNILLNGCRQAFESFPHESPFQLTGCHTILAEYDGKELIGIGVANNMNVKENSDFYLDATEYFGNEGGNEGTEEEENHDEEEDIEDEEKNEEGEDSDKDRKRSRSMPFKVRFAGGKEIYCSNAQKTFIESLRHMGLEKASQFRGDKFKGYSLIGKEEYVTNDGQPRQKYIDGWWIYINMPNWRKRRCIEGVAKMLGIDLTIEDVRKGGSSLFEPEVSYTSGKTRPKGKIARFSLNGSEPMGKNRSVHETVKRFISQFPDASFIDVEEMFPARLQGSYGVVRTIDDINQRCAKNRSESDRWFLDPAEVLMAGDGTRFAVSKEWGNQFPTFQKYLADTFGWILEEA